MNTFVLVDIKDEKKIVKYKELFEAVHKTPLILGEAVRKILKVSNIRDLALDTSLDSIVTLHMFDSKLEMNQDEIRKKICKMIENLEKTLDITLNGIIKKNLSNISIDETMDETDYTISDSDDDTYESDKSDKSSETSLINIDSSYDFSDNSLKISKNLESNY